MYALAHPLYDVQRYQIFIIYIGFTLLAMCLNIWGVRLLPLVNKVAILWSLAGATTIAIVCLACSSGEYQPGSFVFGSYINETGCVVFFLSRRALGGGTGMLTFSRRPADGTVESLGYV